MQNTNNGQANPGNSSPHTETVSFTHEEEQIALQALDLL